MSETVDLKIPSVGESITEVTIGAWRKSEGDTIEQDEEIVELESEKATFELPAPTSGVLTRILKDAGETAAVGEVIAQIGPAADDSGPSAPAKTVSAPKATKPPESTPQPAKRSAASAPSERPANSDLSAPPKTPRAQPVARKVDTALQSVNSDREEVVAMSPIRRRIAKRLVEAQQTAALLTTFNEIDMSAVIALRQKYRDRFAETHGIKLGFMSFFVKAVVEALASVPQLNAEVRGNDIVYFKRYDIGIAVGGESGDGSKGGLVVPVLRNADALNFFEIERAVSDFARRASENSLKLEELRGGTFTISNGGIYGSLLSTPIVNPPQSGILGMHAIQDRPVARDGNVVIRPMMYVALTYDHRVVDGRDAVLFLRRVREIVEDPLRLLIEV